VSDEIFYVFRSDYWQPCRRNHFGREGFRGRQDQGTSVFRLFVPPARLNENIITHTHTLPLFVDGTSDAGVVVSESPAKLGVTMLEVMKKVGLRA
jgi:hypothetical protein